MKLPLLLLALVSATSAPAAVDPLTAPLGPAPMIDHRLDDPAWRHAARRTFSDGTEIWLQQDSDYVYLAIKAPSPRVFGMELYIAEAPDRLVNLHASAYLGERTAANGRWPDWTWWNADRWTATIVPYLIENNQRTFSALAGKEFQLSKSRFAAARYRVRFELHYNRHGSTIHPEGSAEFDPAGWLELVLR